eukprot:6071596-Pleurochrysis_carterae.AAC.1
MPLCEKERKKEGTRTSFEGDQKCLRAERSSLFLDDVFQHYVAVPILLQALRPEADQRLMSLVGGDEPSRP